MSDASELIARSQEHLSKGKHLEAIASALAATSASPEQLEAWWQLAKVRIALDDARNAVEPLKKVVALDEYADGAWARLAWAHSKLGETEQAKVASRRALQLNEEHTLALSVMCDIQIQENDNAFDNETLINLERLDALRGLDEYQNHFMGNIHYRANRPHEAIKYWRKAGNDKTVDFNIALTYSHDLISQDADAVDMLRQLLNENPDFTRAKDQLEKLKPKLTNLASDVAKRRVLYISRQPYDIYLNPYSLLNLDDADTLEPPIEKDIIRFKKSILQEIELENGHLEWLPGIEITKSRAISLIDELSREIDYHWCVFKYPILNRFLTHGDIEFFFVNNNLVPLDVFKRVRTDNEFCMWLGKYFAPQYDRTLSRAIDNKDVTAIECLLDGRRWVDASQEDDCFVSSRRSVHQLLAPLDEFIVQLNDFEPSPEKLAALLDQHRIVEILNLLPMQFEDAQSEIVHKIRDVCFAVFTKYQDADLARQFLLEAKRFKFRSVSATANVDRDQSQLEEIISEERKSEARFNIGEQLVEITKTGVQRGATKIPLKSIEGIKVGMRLTAESGIKKVVFAMYFRSSNSEKIDISWSTSKNFDSQKPFFDEMLKAALAYIVPDLVSRAQKKLESSGEFEAGGVIVDRTGLSFETKGWFKSNLHKLPWSAVNSEMKDGTVTISDRRNPKTRIHLDLLNVENALVLFFLAKQREI